MAEPSVKGQYVRLTVDVWYDRSTRCVHLASTDRDLGPKGLHTDFKPGSTEDLRLRTMLAKYSKLPEDA